MTQRPPRRAPIRVCASEDLREGSHRIIALTYRGEPHSAIVLRFEQAVMAYLNQCAHMPRRLDCEQDGVFDPRNGVLRCSMHGIVYDPRTGESLSAICEGRSLRKIRVVDDGKDVLIVDKHAMPST